MIARVASQSRAEPGGRMWLSEGLILVICTASASKSWCAGQDIRPQDIRAIRAIPAT
jgi:hypothetical protein